MCSQPSRSRPHHRARAAASLLVLGLAALPLIGWSQAVEVSVDGELLTTRTYADTVGGVLDQLEVPVGPADQVTPAPAAPLDGATTIDVQRAITVDIALDGTVIRRVTAPVGTVSGALTAADLDVRELGGSSTPGWHEPVEDGDRIDLHLPRPVRVAVDGRTHELTTLTTTVGAMLVESDIDLGPEDQVDWDLDAPVLAHTTVTVSRVAHEEVVEEVALDHDVVRRETDRLREGTTRTEVEGRDGLRRDIFRVELVDGEEVARTQLESEVVREPRDQVVLVGTAPAPAPPPAETRAAPSPAPAPSSGGADVWDRLARCESGGNWATRGTYHGGLQFHPDTWRAHRPAGAPAYAYEATREQQIAAGRSVQRSQGWSAWPHCARQLGLR